MLSIIFTVLIAFSIILSLTELIIYSVQILIFAVNMVETLFCMGDYVMGILVIAVTVIIFLLIVIFVAKLIKKLLNKEDM